MDTQVPDTTLAYLADHFNHTVVEYRPPHVAVKREYLLDINPWSRQRERGKGNNIIDARWGYPHGSLYRYHRSEPIGAWSSGYLAVQELPHVPAQGYLSVAWTTFEGVLASVPFQYGLMLMEEYSEKVLTATRFHK